MFVRTAGERDLAAIRAVLVEAWHATYDAIHGAGRVSETNDKWHSVASLRSWLVRPNGEFLVADDGTRIGGVGFAESSDSGEQIILRRLCVVPDLQGRGMGGMLLDEVIDSFPEARSIRLELEEENARAVAFFEANGFARETDGGKRAGDTGHMLVLLRPLAG